MQELFSMIHSLEKPQVKILRSYLTYMSVRKDKSNRYLQLLDLLLAGKKTCPSDEECARRLYGQAAGESLDKLKRRLRAKIMDVLTMDININRKDSMDEVDNASARVRKKLLQFQVLYRLQGNLPYNKQLLEDVITESKKFEIYEPLVSALGYRKYFSGFCRGLSDFKRINKEIAFYEYANIAVKRANDLYYQLMMWDSFSKEQNIERKQDFISKCILELKKDFQYTKSASIGYYLKFMEMAYFDNYKEYASAHSAGLELLNFVRSNRAICRKQRIGVLLGNLGHYNIYLGKYHEAALDFQNAQQYFPSGSANIPVSREMELNAWFLANDIPKAEETAATLLKSPVQSQGDFRMAKYRYYYANVLFRKGDHKGALKELSRRFEISRDKAGWEVGVRVLTILCNIELQRFDEAALLAENLRKHTERWGKSEMRQRDKLIVRLLGMYAQKGFLKDGLPASFYAGLEQLAGGDKKYAWEPLTPELIPFHEWIMGRLNLRQVVRKAAEAKRLPAKRNKRELVPVV
ncbi:MAG: hypothetical protein AB1458_15720 [Bacteroidota bacterium]